MVLTFLMAVLASLVAAVFRSEIEGGVPWLAEQLRRLALRAFHGDMRDRMDEEWRAFLSEMPTPLSRLAAAFGFVIAGAQIQIRHRVNIEASGLALWTADRLYATSRWLVAPLMRKVEDERVDDFARWDFILAHCGQQLFLYSVDCMKLGTVLMMSAAGGEHADRLVRKTEELSSLRADVGDLISSLKNLERSAFAADD